MAKALRFNPKLNPQAVSALLLNQIIRGEATLAELFSSPIPHSQAKLIQEIVSGCCRYYPQLEWIRARTQKTPQKTNKTLEKSLFLGMINQFIHTKQPKHTTLNESVKACFQLKRAWYAPIINAAGRRFLAQQEELCKDLKDDQEAKYSHPHWYISALQEAWPAHWENILTTNLQHPRPTLRIQPQHTKRDDFLAALEETGIKATPCSLAEQGVQLALSMPIRTIPGYEQGWFSIQDAAAQLAAPLLHVQPGMRVLDACAAPGGKTGHILECCADVDHITALDISERRLQRVKDNLQRTHNHLLPKVTIQTGDACDPKAWWDGKLFDRILLDAPCSASGIYRRQPDIKIHRKPEHITHAAETQAHLLDTLWSLLKPDGLLLYVTCSIFPTENDAQITAFLDRTEDVETLPLSDTWGLECPSGGRQLLPCDAHDGFFYACLKKQTA